MGILVPSRANSIDHFMQTLAAEFNNPKKGRTTGHLAIPAYIGPQERVAMSRLLVGQFWPKTTFEKTIPFYELIASLHLASLEEENNGRPTHFLVNSDLIF